MNQKIISTFLLAGLGILVLLGAFSCSKDSVAGIPVETSFEAPEEALSRYNAAIRGSEYGWEFSIYTKNNSYFAGYLDFGTTSNAEFTVDVFAPAQVALRTTEFGLRISGPSPVLSFPAGAFREFAEGQTGIDTAFSFQAARRDSVYLLGNRYGNQLILTKASIQKSQGYREGAILNTLQQMDRLARLPKYFKRLVVNGAEYDLHFRPEIGTLYIHYGGIQRFTVHETLYAPTATGISLQKPLVDGINVIAYLDALAVDLNAATLSAVVGGVSRTFTNEYAPSAYDVTAAQKFYGNPPYQINIEYISGTVTEQFSPSRKGFTVAGHEDAYGVKEIPGFQYLMFIHQMNGQVYGALRVIANNQLSAYGPAVQSYSTTGNLIRFQYLGSFGEPPEEISAAVDQTIAAFTDQYGFYVVPAGGGIYDLVSNNVTGGQKWIRFE